MARRMDGMVVRAEQLGIHGPFLAALRKSMDNAYLSVYVNGCVGDRFRTYRGTKQGSELSPLLFGLFIEQLHELIAMKLPGAGPLIGDMRVPEIMYADDVKLLAVNDPKALQELLDVLHLFCLLFDMEVNLKPHKRERERSTRGDRVLFSSVGLWEGFLGVKITRIPYHWPHKNMHSHFPTIWYTSCEGTQVVLQRSGGSC